MYKSYAAQGARVIALASKTLVAEAGADTAALKAMARAEVEDGMTWVGFAVFQVSVRCELVLLVGWG